MELKCNVTGPERKRLVHLIAEITESDAKYLGVPSCAYQVDYFTIDKNGCVFFDDSADSEIIEQLIDGSTRKVSPPRVQSRMNLAASAFPCLAACSPTATWKTSKPSSQPKVFIRTDPAGNIEPDKEKSTEKIDGAVATIMALDRAIHCGNDTSASVYDERGLLFL